MKTIILPLIRKEISLNSKTRNMVKNLRYALSANFFVLIIAVILNIFLPKYFSIKTYSYWQLYLFYLNYIGFFHFGWLDGIYLEYSGDTYDKLNKKKISTFFWAHLCFQMIILLILILIINFISAEEKYEVLLLTILAMIISNMRTFVLVILQATSRIKEYSQIAKNDRFILLILIIVYILTKGDNFAVLILFDIISKLIITVIGIYFIRDAIKIKPYSFKVVVPDFKRQLISGSSIMLSTIITGLITGVLRIFIENNWNIDTFGKISFTLNISNLFLIFIGSISIVVFPIIKRSDDYFLKNFYLNFRNLIVPICYASLLFLFPIKIILSHFLPEYSDSIFYSGIIFPTVVFEIRLNLLVYNYLKNFKEEKVILLVNFVTLIFSVFLSSITVYVFKSLLLSMVVLLICSVIKCILAEMYLAKYIQVKLDRKITFDIIMTTSFVLLNIFQPVIIGAVEYLLIIIIYLINQKKEIMESFYQIKNIIKNQ
ncbi:lipopolysaccharide biosynthesis protein [Enterococcus italicus]